MSKKISDHLSLYREEQRKKYQRYMRSKYLSEKYSNILELDKIKRSSARIVNFAKKYVLLKPLNDYDLPSIPGIFRYRIHLTELNICPLDIQEELFANYTESGDVKHTIIKSMQHMFNEICIWVIDLRVYGPNPTMTIDSQELDMCFHLSENQINKIRHIWNTIDPDTRNGIRYRQMIDNSVSLSLIYSKLPDKVFK